MQPIFVFVHKLAKLICIFMRES